MPGCRLMSQFSAASVKTIGVLVGGDLVGDALIKLPFVRALRAAFPQAEISWMSALGTTAYAGILRTATAGLIDHVLEQPDFLPARRRPQADVGKAPYFDLLIDTRNRWREAVRARRMPHGVFIAPALRYLLSDRRRLMFAPKKPHLVDRLFDLVELASGTRPQVIGGLPLPPGLLRQARDLLPKDKTCVGFAPGAGNSVKIWPLANFIAVARTQAEKGRAPVFLLGPQETEWRERIAQDVPSALFPLQDRAAWGTPKASIEETIALGHALNLAVTNDSGTSHMLAAADCALISLFGPTDPRKLAPRISHAKVLRAQDFAAGENMEQIPVAAVAAAVETMLADMFSERQMT